MSRDASPAEAWTWPTASVEPEGPLAIATYTLAGPPELLHRRGEVRGLTDRGLVRDPGVAVRSRTSCRIGRVIASGAARVGRPAMGDARAEVMQELTTFVETHVGRGRRWYAEHTFRPRMWSRLVGTAIIAFSVSLPLLATQEFRHQALAVSLVGVLVAGLSGLAAFFRWDESWKANVSALMEFEHLLASWELRMLEARHAPDVDQGTAMAVQATRDLLAAARQVDVGNTQAFFQNMRVPEGKK
jgi:hypothetical protein